MSKANEALDKMAENARELGLDYEPAQQEPVALLRVLEFKFASVSAYPAAKMLPLGTYDLYTSPPAQRKPLTNEQIIEWVESGEYNVTTNDWASHIAFARAIEAAHGIKE